MNTLFQLSLLASFIAGMVALFAPCCITFLLPSYFANVFKEKKRVVLMTFIYSLGIFTVMFPVVLGARALSQLFYSLHDQVYVFGGVLMVVLGFVALLGLKLPMPNITTSRKADDPVSTYILGVVAGITSSCCAPVLLGVLTLTSMSPTLLTGLLVGFFYVLGMVTPLYVASLFIDKRNILENPVLRRVIYTTYMGSKSYPITWSSVISFVMFVGIGVLSIFLSLTGKLAMDQSEMAVTAFIQKIAVDISDLVKNIPGLDIIFLLVSVWLLYKFIRYMYSKDTRV